MNPLIGTLIGGKYRLDRPLGQGGMGMVFAATQVGLNRRCAVKVLHEALSQDHQLVARFKREAEVAASIGHPNIIQVTDFGYEDGKVFLVMDLLQGMPLAEALEREAPLSAERVRFIATQVLSALDAAHQREIVHRDLKPDNIYLTSLSGVADVVKLLDFGIARITSEQSQKMTTTGQVLGTPAYMSPEQARGKAVDHRTDLYSLGVVMYQALSGRMPVDGSNYHELMFNIVGETPTPLQEYRPDLPNALTDIVAKAMAKKVEERYQSATEMRRELEALGPVDATSPAAVQVPSDPPARADDAFAKTVTPQAVLPVDTRRPQVAREPAREAPRLTHDTANVDGTNESGRATAIWVGAFVVTMLAVGFGVWAATRPAPELADARPQVDQESEVERRRELAKRMVEEMRRIDMEQHPETEMVSEMSTSEMVSEMSTSEMRTVTMTSMASAHGRPAHVRRFGTADPSGRASSNHCCPRDWWDGYGNPVVWARCGAQGHTKEVYPVLANTRLQVQPSRNPHVVPRDDLRAACRNWSPEITQCFRRHDATLARGQYVELEVDASGTITGTQLQRYCPLPEPVRRCIQSVFDGDTLPTDRGAPGGIRVSFDVAGA